MAVIDADPYTDDGTNWYINQNNFFRQVRNFVIDLTALGQGSGAGIHWQVAQATSLQNIRFEMVRGGGAANKQQGIFMDNGSGGFMADLTFNGGGTGAFLGAQQFTLRNVSFNHCHTAVFMNWNWVFSFKNMRVNDCAVGLNMTNGGSNQTVGSVVLLESEFKQTDTAIATVFGDDSQPDGAGTLVLQNVDLQGAAHGVVSDGGRELLDGGQLVHNYVQGNVYSSEGDGAASAPARIVRRDQSTLTTSPSPTTALPEEPLWMTTLSGLYTYGPADSPSSRPATTSAKSKAPTTQAPSPAPPSTATTTLAAPPDDDGSGYGTCAADPTLASARASATQPAEHFPSGLTGGSQGATIPERSRPQYEDLPASSFVSIKSLGAKGDGQTDDTEVFQKAINDLQHDQVLFIDHGLYVLTDTISIPAGTRITGEIWPVLAAYGEKFQDQTHPRPLLRVGAPDEIGTLELTDLVVSTKGPAAGAVLIEWNIAGEKPGDAGMWDVHTRIGGFAGSDLQSDTCPKTPKTKTEPDPKCVSGFAMMRVSPSGSGYFENNWYWVADHELDRADHSQINVYTGRGVLIEGAREDRGNWFIGTASEHSTLYNYQISNARNVYMTVIQTETPYYQSNPTALVPYRPGAAECETCEQADASNGTTSARGLDARTDAGAAGAGWNDPTFEDCQDAKCTKAWGVRVVGSDDVYIFGAGLYSFFENYGQKCLETENCQTHMVELDCVREDGTPAHSRRALAADVADLQSTVALAGRDNDAAASGNVRLYALSTKASVNMVTVGGKGIVPGKGNKSTFCHTVALVKAD
ncbi:hypothetical protein KEM52_006587 [Ascosphaera acerosa]|nr:hypothetical protein KEM52_006587 [Ascosphaera acerosa]